MIYKNDKDSFLTIIDQIESALECDLLLPALSLSLTLPDTCGKAEFPNLRGKKRYIKWFDDHIGKYEQKGNFISEEGNNHIDNINPLFDIKDNAWYHENDETGARIKLTYIDYPYLSGEVVYGLRCMFLHESKHDVGSDIDGINNFELILDDNKTGIFSSSASISSVMVEGVENKEEIKTLIISVRELCYKICSTSKHFYQKNSNLFEKQQYHLSVNISNDKENIIRNLLREVRTANRCGLYHVALSTALQLPDICAQVDKDTNKLGTSEKYRSWYETHIENKELKKYECNEDKDIIPPFVVTAENAYKLRCNYLHSGILSNRKDPHDDVKMDENSDTNIQLIEVYYDVNSEHSRSKTVRKKENAITPIRLNAKEYSEMICSRVEEYYSRNTELFEDLNYSLYAMSDQYQLFKE